MVEILTGPRGGKFYRKNGKKVYVKSKTSGGRKSGGGRKKVVKVTKTKTKTRVKTARKPPTSSKPASKKAPSTKVFVTASGYDHGVSDAWHLPGALLEKHMREGNSLNDAIKKSFPPRLASRILKYKPKDITAVGYTFGDVVLQAAAKKHIKRKGPVTDSGKRILQDDDIPITLMDESEFPEDHRWKSSSWGPLMVNV